MTESEVFSMFKFLDGQASYIRLDISYISCTVAVENAAQNHSDFWICCLLLRPGVAAKKELPKFPF